MRFLAVILLTVAPAVTFAQTAPASSPTKADPAKKICHVEIETGSIFHKRVCRTKAEWAEIAAMDQKNTENFQNRRSTNMPTTE